MAAHAIPNYSRDVRHGKSGSGSSLGYGPVPGSPTLTNPDMILPDYDCDVSLDGRSQSPLRIWNNPQTTDMRFHLPSTQNQFIAGPITPSTPIIYGNGTMLSDIGEVTEVESVVGKGRRGSHLSVYSNEDHVLGSSPTMGVSRIKSRSQILQRERKSSIDSNSTITSQGRAATFGDFDDSASVDDVHFQGDDEESMASSYVEGTATQEPMHVLVHRYGASSYRSPTGVLDPTLETLSEDEGGANGDNMPRSASVAQVRDLKHQMKDLKGKISNLKEQARADSLKRRSLQSLRTPSPFTHARWDQGFPESRKSQDTTPETSPFQPPWKQESQDKTNGQISPKHDSNDASELEQTKVVDDEYVDAEYEDAPSGPEMSGNALVHEHAVSPRLAAEPDLGDKLDAQDDDYMIDDGETWEGDLEQDGEEVKQVEQQYNLQNGGHANDMEDDDDDEFVDFESESGESSYHDAFQVPVSHEDREDAFDYEHFFLHSAMGSMSQHRRDSWSSVCSSDSVETTRGPVPATAPATDFDSDHERRPSVDTMSSFSSFTTATEGRSSRSSNLDDTTETVVDIPDDSGGPRSSKRTTFGGFKFPLSKPNARNGSVDLHQNQHRRATVVHRPASSAATYARHRPSVSSFGSTGTNRSFPLVDKSKGASGILTPTSSTPGASPDSELRQISQNLLNEAASLGGIENGQNNGNASAVPGLDKESQILVERLVASLGKCVLGLTESSRAGSEARMYRRRIDTARRILEGLED
ncbi:uncharacterized protein QYS62_001008 [Fusarium acuminatum]|uniref:Uncharacterized protein n=1 Tax=Fusarium acuminatum TaxID=5515 RepID=A0ABZ2WHB9_9HYPO